MLASYDDRGRVTDFGTLEVQAVYVSGNIRQPFEYYMENPARRYDLDWANRPNYPRPDYLSSSRKRLVPQLITKGGILRHWGIKQAVALHAEFFRTLPLLPEVEPQEADMIWLIYDLAYDSKEKLYHLKLERTAHTLFRPVLDQIMTAEPGPVEEFIGLLQEKLDKKLEGEENPPDAPTLADLL